MKAITRILVPTDFSECAAAALDHAIDLGRRLGASVDVVHVLDLPHYLEGQIMVATGHGEPEPLDRILVRHAEERMERFLAQTPGVQARVESGDTVRRIVEVAARGGYDLVVMGTHGKKRGVLTGSVTERVVRQAPCPVLAVRDRADDPTARIS